ncbi:MAG: hypothetical protein Q4E09_04360 [Eubacteriales bacterium]|nr:hypothetical protein [Eubacteriales bacterium]
MIYIPRDWLNNKENEPEVRELISTVLGCFNFSASKNDNEAFVKARLKELGEEKILQELSNGSFAS